jgi:P2-related tail formation protein
MPEWTKEIVLAIVVAATGGIGWWFKSWREDRIKREATQQAIVDKLEARNEALRGKVESLLMDAYAHEREANALRAERLAMDKQLAAVATAMTAALERADATNARLSKDGR